MRLLLRSILAGFIAGILVATNVLAQEEITERLNLGKQHFWSANFDQALTALRAVINDTIATRENLAEAYLYTGFVLTRQEALDADVEDAFAQALIWDPNIKLDENVIPPFLVERFNTIRDKIVGCAYLDSEPPGVSVAVLSGARVVRRGVTPMEICELAHKSYEVLIADERYTEEFQSIQLTAGRVDTVFLNLTAAVTKKEGSKMWPWLAGGGLLATAAAVVYKTVLASDKETVNLLPTPPDRPRR